ncbi:MAG: two-component regulator propeller domain-containing protein [Crocinitomicaceae bacterium]|nr:two-component regulator propeller domain-containing protein [Crocinitomicaceae bacterium]
MKVLRIISCILLLLNANCVDAQQYNFRNYNVEDGLGQSQVYAMYQDVTGKIWMGTRGGGISIFDGFSFETKSTYDGLPSNYINAIEEDHDGKIWIATNNGLCNYDGFAFTKVQLNDEGISIVVRDLFVTEDNHIYCATNEGLYEIFDGKVVQRELPSGDLKNMDVLSLYVESHKQIWIGTEQGLLKLSNENLINYGDESVYMKNAITVIKKDEEGQFWFGTYGDGMYTYNGDRFFRIDYHHELYRQTVFDIYFTENEVWVATLKGGIVQYNKGTKVFRSITEQEGLSNNHVRCIMKDMNGNHWFGTSGGGVCHFLGKQFTNYDKDSGLAGNYIYSVLRDSKNRLWIGNSQLGVSVLTQTGFVNYDASNEFKNIKVKALAEDALGNIWLGSDGQGVYVYNEGKFEAIEELSRAYVKQIKIDPNGDVWIATAGSGLIRVEIRDGNYLIEKYTTEEGIISNRITTLHFDTKGRLWYGTESNGVGCFASFKNRLQLTTSNGLPSNQIRSIAESEDGRLWIGTAGAGVCGFHIYEEENQPIIINEQRGLRSDNVYLLAFDQENKLIVGTEKGLDFVLFNEMGAVTQIKHYGKLDGFTGVETCQNAVWRELNGSMWFGTINGLSHYNPSEISNNERAPVLSLSDIKIFYESHLEKSAIPILNFGKQVSTIVLPYHQNHITFDFLGVNMPRPEGVLYRWKLVGFDDEYSPASNDQSILYSNLNSGEYTFMLIASNEDGVWSEQPLEFKFEISAPFWRKPWFLGAMIILALLLLYFSYKFSVKRIQSKAEQKQEKIQFEKDFLELEQKAMRLQMNPHFIFNALNSIQSLIGTGKETEARYYLAKFSRLMRQILDNSRKSEITLEEEINTLENYLLVEQFCNGDRFNYEIKVSDTLEKDFINIPPMLLQPFVENSIKHGMKGISDEKKDGVITILFEENNGILECIIEDNGIGREKAAELRKVSKETYHTSTGLSVTTERLNRIDAEYDIVPLEIIDLYTKGVASGTKVIIRIPID